MALPNIFTQTPIEASIWTAAVGMQVEVARILKSTPLFWGAIGLVVGLALIMFLWRLGRPGSVQFSVAKLATMLVTICFGVSFLSYQNTSPFSPVNSRGQEWRSMPRVSQNPKYKDLTQSTNGLYWYTVIHRAMIEVSDLLTSVVGYVANDPFHKEAPEYLVNALSATARMSIDDPNIERSFDELVARCTDTKQGQVLGNTDSVKSLFQLQDPWCQNKYNSLQTQLKTWARNNRPRTLSGNQLLTPLMSLVGIHSETDVDNKMIASAVKNYARTKAGETFAFHNTNTNALVGGTDFWVNLSKGFSPTSNFLSLVNGVRSVLGLETRDLEGANARNEAAVTYNKMLAFLPAARGYAKAIIAILFIPASLALCLGVTGYFFGWLKMTALFTLYQPISAAFYYFTTKLIATTETIKAMDVIRVDPMVLAGADVIDDNLARIQAVYFCIQLGLLFTVAVAGIRAFGALRSLRHSYLSELVSGVTTPIHTVSHLVKGFSK